MTFSPQTEARFEKILKSYPPGRQRSAMIPLLLYGQDEVGCVSDELIEEVAQRVGVTPLQVNEVLSYYSMLHRKPLGKYHVQICTNISCLLNNGDKLWEQACHKLGIGHKEVTAVVELKARFDEASNIRWARDLEDAGVQVFHGLVGLKTHCKLSLLVRRDPDGVTRQYAHLGTGNYNATTARIYTDLSLLTADPEITGAVHNVFSFLTAYAEHPDYAPMLVAPLDLAEKCMSLIEREAEHARMGRPARMIVKINSLVDKNIVQALYRASQAGVDIEMLVRGICSLRPGIRGLSDRIRVRSIVGRFLEHSRIFYFENGGEPEVYLGSADWMPRNLHERVEVLFPLKNPLLRDRVVHEILAAYLADNVKARFLQKDGRYLRPWQSPKGRSKRPPRGPAAFSAQDFLIGLAEGT
ncbi:MAG: NAD(P)H-dependent oxidoreductase subunit E, partial [Acidobacteriia bacterium]|nr:NAD(P)H-dependent oxidoreductase subunit E [Terriglobia bacterium]